MINWIKLHNLHKTIQMADIEGLTEANRPKKTVDIIEPNTTRVLELRRIREEQERQKR